MLEAELVYLILLLCYSKQPCDWLTDSNWLTWKTGKSEIINGGEQCPSNSNISVEEEKEKLQKRVPHSSTKNAAARLAREIIAINICNMKDVCWCLAVFARHQQSQPTRQHSQKKKKKERMRIERARPCKQACQVVIDWLLSLPLLNSSTATTLLLLVLDSLPN